MGEVDFASDKECFDRRNELIKAKIIYPKKDNTFFKNGEEILSTIDYCKNKRLEYIKSGVISDKLCEVLIGDRTNLSEEGEYKQREIKTEDEYINRRAAYFRILQEVIISYDD